MVKRSDNCLQGMKEICSYVNRSEATVINWIRAFDFPASKIGGGIWEADKVNIDKWRQARTAGKPVKKNKTRRTTQKEQT